MNDLKKNYEIHRIIIKERLSDFKNLSEEDYIKELFFCLLTPQSNAQRCWKAVQELFQLKELEERDVFNILKTKTRFHITKTKRIINANNTWQEIKPYLNNEYRRELRDFLAEKVNGFGLKEASHFLRNIGKSDNQIAILDRHVLKNLVKYDLIKNVKIKSKKQYLEMEQSFLKFANQINIPPDELDLLWWSQENGEIFK